MSSADSARVNAFLGRLHAVHPDLQIESVSHLRGQFNDALILNHEFVFRFPRSPYAARMLIDEVAVLQAIRPFISLPTPNPEFGDISVVDPFVGYRLIPGESLRREDVATMRDPAALQHLADQLAIFLTELHAVPIERLGDHIPRRDDPRQWADMYAEIQEKLFPVMRPDAVVQVRRHFESYLSNSDHFAFEPAMRHGDFGAGNILWDAETCTVTGVIDFSFAGIGDAAIDAAAISTMGEPFLERMFRVYPALATTIDRVRFYRGTYALKEALDGLRDGDAEAFENGMRAYR